MNEIKSITEKLAMRGFKFRTVDIGHLPELLESIHRLERGGAFAPQVSGNYIKYYTSISNMPPSTKTLFIIAQPSMITEVNFTLPTGLLTTIIPPQYIGAEDDLFSRDTLTDVLIPAGYTITRTTRIPLKTLAVRSGLAQYGLNNISYVNGSGSFLRLNGFYSDIPCPEDNWGEPAMMTACDKCRRCRDNCPTGAIDSDRFQVHAEKCLTFVNESPGDFPSWVKPEWHNSLIGCTRCQDICPVNQPYLEKRGHAPTFSASETEQILKKTAFSELDAVTQQKLRDIAYDDTWLYVYLARNLGALVTASKNKI